MPEGLQPTGDTDDAVISIAGVVKWFDVPRGFGFVVADDPALDDVLIHFSVLKAHGRRSFAHRRPDRGFGCSRQPRPAGPPDHDDRPAPDGG